MNSLEKHAAKKTLARKLSKYVSKQLPSRMGLSSSSSGLPLALIGGLGAGAATYAAMRKFRPSASPGLRSLQSKAGKSYTVDVGQRAVGGVGGKLQRLLLGESLFKSKKPGVVLRHTDKPTPGVTGTVDINKGSIVDALHDKKVFHTVMDKGVGAGPGLKGALPTTKTVSDALKEVGGDPAKLKDMFPSGFVIKPRTGSMSEGVTKTLDSRAGRDALNNPERFIIQNDLKLTGEYRVHTVDGVPFSSSHRFLPEGKIRDAWGTVSKGGGAFVPLAGKQRREVMDFVRNASKHLKSPDKSKSLSDIGESMHVAWDVGRAADGSLKLIEANPIPGTLMNPVVSQKLRRQVTGRWSPEVAAMAGLGAGGVAGAAIKRGLRPKPITEPIVRASRRLTGPQAFGVGAAGVGGAGGLAAILSKKRERSVRTR